MKIGIMGGTFNPPHNGHLRLARQYQKTLSLDRILWIPTKIPPHKEAEDLAGEADRLEMVRRAIAGDPGFQVSTVELEREGKSYTADTLRQLTREFPRDRFFLLVGSDMFLTFHEWKEYREICQMATLCSAARGTRDEVRQMCFYASRVLGLPPGKCFIGSFPPVEISSTQVRRRVRAGEEIGALVPPGVAEYIAEKGLYHG